MRRTILSILTAAVAAFCFAAPASAQSLPLNKWYKYCDDDGTCVVEHRIPKWQVIFQIAIRPAAKQPIIAAAIWWRDAERKPGMTWQIDDGKTLNVPYIECSKTRCSAQVELNNEYLDVLRKGSSYHLGATREGRYVLVDVPLRGFRTAYDGKPSMTWDKRRKLQEAGNLLY